MELRFAKLGCVALRLKTVEGVGTVQCVGILRCAQNDGLWPFGRALRDAQVSFANLGHPRSLAVGADSGPRSVVDS